jgi:hypothetical protein
MKRTPFFLTVFTIMILSIGCNKDSYMEGLGFTSDVGSTPSAQGGRITFFCTNSNMSFCSAGLEVSISSVSKGWIREYSLSSATCGSTTSRSLSLVLPPGSYTFSISGSGSFCPRYSLTRTITVGVCLLLELT